MARVQSILGWLGTQHAALIVDGEKSSVLAQNQGSYFGSSPPQWPRHYHLRSRALKNTSLERAFLCPEVLSSRAFCTDLLQIQCSPSHGFLWRSRSLSSEGLSFPGRGLCLPLWGSSWLTVNKHSEFAYPNQILPARLLPGEWPIAMTTVSTVFMMFARWKSLPQAARCWGEDRKGIQRKVMQHASSTGRADKSYSDHQWLHPDPPHTPKGMINQL